MTGSGIEVRVGARARSAGQAHREVDGLDEAIAVTAHELRGPLLAARAAMASVLHRGQVADDDAHLLRRSLAEVDYSASLLEALLRWVTGDGSLERRRIDLVALVRSAVESCRSEARGRITVDAPAGAVCLADPILLRVAIENVIRNALAYSPPGSAVEVSVVRRGRTIVITVADQGPGVAEHEREVIFDRFSRGEAGRDRPGAGLGLYLARRVIDAHRGEIRVESHGPGATLRIRLAN